MFKFSDVVKDVLFEVDGAPETPTAAALTPEPTNTGPLQKPEWFTKILEKHKELFNTDIPDDRTLRTIYAIAIKRPSKSDILQVAKYVRILDVLTNIYNTLPDRPKNIATFFDKSKDSEAGIQLANEISKVSQENKYTWEIENGLVRNAYNLARSDADKNAAVALATYNNQSILETTKQIVTKRTSVWDRIINIKSPTQPFTLLITDIFKYPEDYMAGRRKVSGDFQEIVDGIYPQNLFNVGLAAKEFFAAEIARLKMEPSENEEPTQQNASLNLFDSYVDAVLIKEKGVVPTLVQGARRGLKLLRQGERLGNDPEYRQRYTQLKNRLKQDMANYVHFLKGEPIEYKKLDAEGKETGQIGTTVPQQYTIGQISKLETPEAQNLITALRGIAEYVRKNIGLGQAVKRTAGALGALRTGMGPVG